MNNEISFWHADKHRNILQVDTIALVVGSQACQKYSKQVYNSLQYVKEDKKDEDDF